MTTLEEAFSRTSPRLMPRRPTWLGYGIFFAVAAFSLAMLSSALFDQGMVAWAAGFAFIAYDTGLLLFVAWKTLPLRDMPINQEFISGSPMPSLGVIVAAYNEADVLERTITALLSQETPPQQILIADDGSQDGTAQLLCQRYGFSLHHGSQKAQRSPHLPELSWLALPHGGKARALNGALTQITTELVVTVDADTLLAPNALTELRSAFARNSALVAATGILTPICDRNLSGKLLGWFQTYEYIRNFISRFAWMRHDSLLLISGAFAGFRRQALLEVGGFDPFCLVEDYEVIHRLYRYSADQHLGWQISVVGSAQARTSAPSSLKGFLQQRRRWFAGFLQTHYWNRDMTGNRKYGRLGSLMLPVKTLDTVQPFYGLMGSLLLLLFFLEHRTVLLSSLFSIISLKIAVDLAFHLWAIFLYRRWTKDHTGPSLGMAIAAALLEPFSFQVLRHIGAALGWFHFLTGRRQWGQQRRHQMA